MYPWRGSQLFFCFLVCEPWMGYDPRWAIKTSKTQIEPKPVFDRITLNPFVCVRLGPFGNDFFGCFFFGLKQIRGQMSGHFFHCFEYNWSPDSRSTCYSFFENEILRIGDCFLIVFVTFCQL